MTTLNLSFNLGALDANAEFDRSVSIQKGTSSFRFLPPYASATGILFHKYSLHWGFTGQNGKRKPVSCSYPTEKYCPVCDRVRQVQDEVKRAELNGNVALVEELNGWIFANRVNNSFFWNAVTRSGEVVMLRLGKTAHDGVIEKISEAATKKGFDPVAIDSGVWIEITKSGAGLNTEYRVGFSVQSVNVNGEVLEKLDRTPLSAELTAALKNQLAGNDGPIKNIHTQYDKSTSAELAALLNGTVVPAESHAVSAGSATATAAVAFSGVNLPAGSIQSTVAPTFVDVAVTNGSVAAAPAVVQAAAPVAVSPAVAQSAPVFAVSPAFSITAEIERLKKLQQQG